MSMQDYEIVRTLGRGAHGTAYQVHLKAAPPGTHLFVAKEIDLMRTDAPKRDQALREAEVLKSLSHVNVVAYSNAFLEGTSLFIIMEYCNAGDLCTAIKRRKRQHARYHERDVMAIFVQLSLALQHLHKKHVLHRDLKTANVFLNQNGVVKLGDFGVAKTLSETAGVASTCVGTPYYLAPEICRSQPYGFKADVWSLGVILYELVTLEVPFSAPDVLALVMRICNDKPRPAPTVYSEALRNLLEKLLQKDSAARPTSTEILADPHMQRGLTLLLSHTTEHGTGGAEMAIREPPSPARGSSTPTSAQKADSASQGEMIEADPPAAIDVIYPASAESKGPVTLPVVDRAASESPVSDGSMVEESAPCSPASPSRNVHMLPPVDDREVTALRLSLLSVLEEALCDKADEQMPESVDADADAMQEDILSDSLIRELDVSV
eukprot:gnl/MRDRNA2_/MRDRNA2_160843_c0_seq1.p1 gnl/MRDRNA2_/MRDRNA2_160843_c0~~gnl/MRDRNA2_/MRDRNA2_160843_c0_seq1.p1  ORF type:complete len:436 (-),score=88.01 gnl/MRDRNA2_/MRDRNA2_160843_c0_seq1:6-1313(-)